MRPQLFWGVFKLQICPCAEYVQLYAKEEAVLENGHANGAAKSDSMSVESDGFLSSSDDEEDLPPGAADIS